MAAILKLPSSNSKGVLSFTSPERDNIIFGKDRKIYEEILKIIKKNWLIGIHHNWHDFQFEYNSLFDFHLAGDGDLIEKNGVPFPLIPMDACNFVPDCFQPSNQEKFWDILYVARGVFFKRIPEFFKIIRNLYDKSKHYRVLLISPVNPETKNLDTEFSPESLKKLYNDSFSKQEQEKFTLLALDYNYPFPLDLETLAYFYKSSKIFVHSANDERRCRVVSYAFASDLPVVAQESVGSLLPKEIQKPPVFYLAHNYDEFPDIIQVLLDRKINQHKSNVKNLFLAEYTKNTFIKYINNIDKLQGFDTSKFFLEGLDLRLGRHHGLSTGKNSIKMDLIDLLEHLDFEKNLNEIDLSDDPEIKILKLAQMKES